LASFFPKPFNTSDSDTLVGLQKRDDLEQELSQKTSGTGSNPQQYLEQQIQVAQNQLNTLKEKINTLGGGSSDIVIPDFKPNNQKTKSFWKRIEYGLNVQSQKSNPFLPTTSDFTLTTGYKFNDKMTAGVGTGYKLGWGTGFNHISLSSQGVSLRTFLDMKLKGSIWISGGYEENYQSAFSDISILRNQNAWQKSGLIGLTKKYKIGKKAGNVQILWDYLSYSQNPPTPAVKFRIGYTL